jgi:GTP:adenosylcobinamide-phosphate guanylyltransferase
VPGAVRVDEPGLALDVDTFDDLRRVAGRLDPSSVTARRVGDLDMLRR